MYQSQQLIQRKVSIQGKELDSLYEVVREVGRGGCAIVYEAREVESGERVALKLLTVSSNSVLSEEDIQTVSSRFEREARLISSLGGEHIVRLLDMGTYDNCPCMVLEFVEGVGLDEYIKNNAPLESSVAVSIVMQILEALDESHNKGIIHRDLKPSNVMLKETDSGLSVRILDFGIASIVDGFSDKDTLMTQQGSIRGTPSYMAPELFGGDKKATPSSDLYAVGLMLLECFTGEVTFGGSNLINIAYEQVHTNITIPSVVPFSIRGIIRKACLKNPDKRYQSTLAFMEALAKSKERWRSKMEVLITASVVLFVLICGGVVGVWYFVQHVEPGFEVWDVEGGILEKSSVDKEGEILPKVGSEIQVEMVGSEEKDDPLKPTLEGEAGVVEQESVKSEGVVDGLGLSDEGSKEDMGLSDENSKDGLGLSDEGSKEGAVNVVEGKGEGNIKRIEKKPTHKPNSNRGSNNKSNGRKPVKKGNKLSDKIALPRDLIEKK